MFVLKKLKQNRGKMVYARFSRKLDFASAPKLIRIFERKKMEFAKRAKFFEMF